jgi:hypothetical protein
MDILLFGLTAALIGRRTVYRLLKSRHIIDLWAPAAGQVGRPESRYWTRMLSKFDYRLPCDLLIKWPK